MKENPRRYMDTDDYYYYTDMTKFLIFFTFVLLTILVLFPIVGIYIPKWGAIILGLLVYISQYLVVSSFNASSFYEKIISVGYDSWKLNDNSYVYLFNSKYADMMNKHSNEIGGSYFLTKDACYIINNEGEMLMTDTEIPVIMLFDTKEAATLYLKNNKKDLNDGSYLIVPLSLKLMKEDDNHA